jgi:hypothetical protein
MTRRTGAIAETDARETLTPARLREDRLRRVAGGQGLVLRRSEQRGSGAIETTGWWLVDPNLRAVVYPPNLATGASASLDQVEAWLVQGSKPMTKQRYILWRSAGLTTDVGRPYGRTVKTGYKR